MKARHTLLTAAVALAAAAAPAAADDDRRDGDRDVHRALERHLVAHYDFEHPVRWNAAWEEDRGWSGTDIELVNGGAAMRVADPAHRFGERSMQAQQVDPTVAGNDDWKAGVYSPTGVPTLHAFNARAEHHGHGLVQDDRGEPEPELEHGQPERLLRRDRARRAFSRATPTATRCARCSR